MTQLQITPYGSWKSPITSDLIVKETIGLGQLKMNGSDLYWIELRPSEGGRQVIVRYPRDGKSLDITPPDFNARTRVHEYGGGDFVAHDGQVYFTNFADQRIYCQAPGFEPNPLTQKTDVPGTLRYADATLDSMRNRLVCVREDHSESDREAANTLVGINLSDGRATILVSGSDFYSSPRVSPNGSRLAWLTWNHPNMPWDGCELWVGEIGKDGLILGAELIAGGSHESIFQPEWSPDGILHFVSDRTGWWNIYRAIGGEVENLCAMDAEFGAPQWIFGLSTYAFESPNSIVCAFAEQGIWRLGILNTTTRALDRIDLPFTEISYVCAAPGRAIFRAGSPTEPFEIVETDLATKSTRVLRRASNVPIDQGYISEPQAIEFPTENGLTAHGFFYPPKNREFQGPADERPPLLVKSHGGPTSATVAVLMLGIQYWTSRGIAVLDVNYGGSTGYGRAYRERLNGSWGVVDVDDCVNGATFLAGRGAVDSNRLMIDGGSAGGYTTLCALTFRDTFRAGASYFGVSDIEALDEDTHKFESRYSTTLIGPYPERRDLYIERSPIHSADRLACPVIFFQGLEDKVVPPNQAEMMVAALRKKGVPVAYVAFEGEQHGFRKAQNIKRALDGELYFYARVFGFRLVDEIEPVTIENL
jgi:dipeptidyl aminopeptidase/acylaminoacyl peptidase